MHPTADVSSPMTVTVVPAHNFNPEKRKCFSAQLKKGLLPRVSHSSCVCVTLKFLLNTAERCKSCNCNISAPVERCNICNCNITAPLCSVLYNCLVRSKYEIQASFYPFLVFLPCIEYPWQYGERESYDQKSCVRESVGDSK